MILDNNVKHIHLLPIFLTSWIIEHSFTLQIKAIDICSKFYLFSYERWHLII